MSRKNREVSANKKVFRVHLPGDVDEILSRKQQELRSLGIVFNNHLPFIEQISLENVCVVALVYFACLRIGRKRYRRCFIMRSALIASGTGVASFGVCHCL